MLDFGFLSHEDVLEAQVDGGFYHISYCCKKGFTVQAYVAHEHFNVGDFPNIYEALDAANKHYEGKSCLK